MYKKFLVADVETRSKCDLKKRGMHNYWQDKSTEILFAGFYFLVPGSANSNKYIDFDLKQLYAPGCLNQYLEKFIGCLIIAHNYKFEFYAFTHLIKKGILTGDVAKWFGNEENYYCTQAAAQRYGIGASKLENVAFVLKLTTQKIGFGKELIKKYCESNKKGEFNLITHEDHLKWLKYLKADVFATAEIFELLPKLYEESKEWAVFQVNKKMNSAGIQIDMNAVLKLNEAYKKLIEKTEKAAAKFGLEKSGTISISSNIGIKNLLAARGIEVDNAQEKTLDIVYMNTKDKEVKKIIEYRRILQAKAPKKLEQFINLVDKKGIYYNPLNYYGTQPTGRNSGYGVQLHNMPRMASKDFNKDLKNLEAGRNINFGSMIRGLIIPRKGHKLGVGDFSAIELILLAWLTGCEKILENKRKGIKEYTIFAEKIYNKKIDKTKHEKEYNVGKTSVLNLGYGGGNKPPSFTFRGILEKNGIYDIEDSQIDFIIKLYRTGYPEVTEFWRDIENIYKYAILNKGEKKTFKGITFLYSGRALRVKIPSGRTLYYFNPSIKNGKIKVGNHFFWGGPLTAHIVSSLARDVMTDAMVMCDKEKLKVILTIHDELVPEIKTGEVKKKLAVFEKIMHTVPPWCPTLPLTADIKVLDRYTKI